MGFHQDQAHDPGWDTVMGVWMRTVAQDAGMDAKAPENYPASAEDWRMDPR